MTLFEPSTGRLGSPLFLHFFLILTQARIQMHSQSCSWICVCFSLFSLYFQGFSAVSLLFFFVFSLFEKEENKRESCLRRYETVWGAVKRSEALWGLMEPTVRIEGPETEAVEEPLPLKKVLYVVDRGPRWFPVGWREGFGRDMNKELWNNSTLYLNNTFFPFARIAVKAPKVL